MAFSARSLARSTWPQQGPPPHRAMAALSHPLFQRAARLAEAAVYESSPEESRGALAVAFRAAKWRPGKEPSKAAAMAQMEAKMPLPPELQELMCTAAQYTEVATVLRRKGQLDRAVRTMERAVGLCTKSELMHPALAMEAARARINLAATLSEAKRHRAALMAIKKEGQGLEPLRGSNGSL